MNLTWKCELLITLPGDATIKRLTKQGSTTEELINSLENLLEMVKEKF